MKRALLILAAITLTVLVWLVQLRPDLKDWPVHTPPESIPHGAVTVTYLGTSTLLISDGTTQLMTDGYFTRVSRPEILFTELRPDQERIERGLRKAGVESLDALLVLHSHFDHVMDSPTVARRTGAQLLGSASTAQVGRGGQLPESQITTITAHHPYQFGDFTVTFVPAAHVPLPGFVEELTGKAEINEPLVPPAPIGAWQEGGVFGVVIEHPRGSMLIEGSAGAQAGALDGYQADYAFLASASLGKQSRNYQQAFIEETAQQVGAHTIVPIHWDDFFVELSEDVPPLPWWMDDTPASLDAMKRYHDGDLFLLKPFDPLVLQPPRSAVSRP